MSLIQEYRSTEDNIKELQARLQALASDERLKKELEFDQKLRALMAEYEKSPRDVIALLDPSSAKQGAKAATDGRRAARELKIYKNPHTNEVIKTKGGNHKVMKEWKAKWGAEAVKSWLQK